MTLMPCTDAKTMKESQEKSFQRVLYRYFFFQWLFIDMTLANGAIERHAAWEHNRCQRKWLPRYIRRWAMLSTAGFVLGAISDQALGAPVLAAWWYTGSCISVSMLAIIAAMWPCLGRNEPP